MTRFFKMNLNAICILLLIVDSGGGLMLRPVSFLIMIFYAIKSLQKDKISTKFLIPYLLFILSLLPSLVIALLNNIDIATIFSWIFAYLCIPMFYFYVKGSDLKVEDYIKAGGCFAALVVVLFFGRILQVPFVIAVNEFIESRSNGFFGSKNFLSGEVWPNVYFQGTLSLIICGALCIPYKFYWTFCLILISLVLAPSRFGVIVLVMWLLFLFFKTSYKRFLWIPFILIIGMFILENFAFGKEILALFNGESDGGTIRLGHLSSVINEFGSSPLNMLFGFGPGSEFYSAGFQEMATNIEISQLEFIRKYGLISFLFFMVFYFRTVLVKDQEIYFLNGALFLYFLVAFSNPVLSSLFLFLFLMFTYIKAFEPKNCYYE